MTTLDMNRREEDSGMRGPIVATPVRLVVDDPEEVAERCWDAGFTVQVIQDATGRASISLVDPFGHRIDLVPRMETSSADRSVLYLVKL